MLAAKIVAILLVVQPGLGDSEAEAQDDTVRRLRLRRPRPKLVEVTNPDGDLKGSPVELLLADSAESPLSSFRGQNPGSAALNALIATAQREEVPAKPSEVVPQNPAPFQIQVQEPAGAPRQTASTTRIRGRVPQRRRPRPQGGKSEERKRPTGPRKEAVETLERYSHSNEDGSFTFGYVGADGAFREETRGADCITRGKYGYIDPDGVKREYTYTSGLPCDNEEEDENDLQSLDYNNNVEDPINPNERFRQTQEQQLSPEQIPQAAQRQRTPIQRRPEPVAQEEIPSTNTFSNFGSEQSIPQRSRVPPRVPIRASPRPLAPQQLQPTGGALQNLLSIADNGPVAVTQTQAPIQASRAPFRIATKKPKPATPQPAAFDFDSELEGFTLNRPSITFEGKPAQGSVPANSGFQTQLNFNPAAGVFKTSLQQNLANGAQLNLNNNAAPSGTPTTVRPSTQTTKQTRFFTASTPTARRPTTPAPQPSSPAPATNVVLPAGTIKLDFEPLNFPDFSQVTVKATQPPSPLPTRPVSIVTTPSPTRLPPPTVPRQPIRVRPVTQQTTATTILVTRPTLAPQKAPEQPRQSAPASTNAIPNAPAKPETPGSTFFVFQPFNQPQAASAPFRTPVNHNAFEVKPAGAAPAPQPIQLQQQPARQAPVVQQPRPAQVFQQQPARPAPVVQQPRPAQVFQQQPARPAPVVQQPRPAQVFQQQRPAQVFQQQRPAQVAQQPRPAPVVQQPRPVVPQRLQVTQQQATQPQRIPAQVQLQPQQFPTRQQGVPQASVQASRPNPNVPQLQFGFQPVSQQQGQARPAPFTAFTAGRPPQLQGRPAPVQQARPAQQFQSQARPQQLGVPPQLQGAAPQFRAQPGSPQFAQFDSRFAPRPGQVSGQVQLRPAQFGPGATQQQLSVFGRPQQLRGA